MPKVTLKEYRFERVRLRNALAHVLLQAGLPSASQRFVGSVRIPRDPVFIGVSRESACCTFRIVPLPHNEDSPLSGREPSFREVPHSTFLDFARMIPSTSFFYVERGVLCMQWEGPVAMIDIDVPNEGHVAQGSVTAGSKECAYKMMASIASYRGARLSIRVCETVGGLRGFITSHAISARHLWHNRDFAQHLLDEGQDPYYLIGCMATCNFAVRLSPKWIDGQPRAAETIAAYGLINADIPEIPSAVRFVKRLEAIQKGFDGLGAQKVIDAIDQFRQERAVFFVDSPVARPWSLMEGIYEASECKAPVKKRTLVRDLRRWIRTTAVPSPSWGFMAVPNDMHGEHETGTGWPGLDSPDLDRAGDPAAAEVASRD